MAESGKRDKGAARQAGAPKEAKPRKKPDAAQPGPAGWAYLVRCADGSLYAGWTNDLDKRLAAHNTGSGAKYTRGRGPVALAWAQGYPSRRAAMVAEAGLKKLAKPQKEALAAGFTAAGGAFSLAYAGEGDLPYLEAADPRLSPEERRRKLDEGRMLVARLGGRPVGLLRYGLFWDEIPFLNLIWLEEDCRGQGFGRRAMAVWEEEMGTGGYPVVMTSTQADEGAQHFYRRLGYHDAGCLMLAGTPLAQPLEILMVKTL